MTRLRPRWTDEQLAEIYAQPHDHRRFGRGHAERVDETVRQTLLSYAGHPEDEGNAPVVVDLSCGNAFVARAFASRWPDAELVLGDYAPGYPLVGPINQTIWRAPYADIFICGETIEHLDDPVETLELIYAKTDTLILSTPTDNWGDTNAEHYWSWSQDDVEEMLVRVGFTIREVGVVDSRTYGEPYRYGIWTLTA